MKLSYEEKMKIVKMRTEGYSIRQISEDRGIRVSGVYKYLRLYRQYGEEIFKRKRFNSNYSPELKYEIVKRFKLGESKLSLAVEYKIECSMLIKWLRDYEELGYNGLITKKRGRQKMKPKTNEVIDKDMSKDNCQLSSPLTDKEREELIQLRADNKRLKKEKELSEMENEFLKKLDALVQKRLKREKKK